MQIYWSQLDTSMDVNKSKALIAYIGELVVNIWGGVTNPEKKTLWNKNTLSVFYSSTKAISAIVIAHLIDR